MIQKAAFVAIIGRPSVGKSTLLNRLCAEKVAIISSVPQTTRNAIRGIVNRPQGQLVFVDTPGRHESNKKLNRKLMEVSNRSIEECDFILYVLDVSRPSGPEEEAITSRLQTVQEKIFVALNKTDSPHSDLKRSSAFLKEHLPALDQARCFPLSALNNTGIEALVHGLFDKAEPGEPFYPHDYYTDQELHFRIAEIIREKAINRLYDELPHAIYAEVADAELHDDGKTLWVRAFLVTERESQKGIVVGKDGALIKAIRLSAQKELNRIFEWKVKLDLRVKTVKDWRHSDGTLRKLIV
ncbi:MAG: GTPase Era [Spirochaetaceae bacterium]|jgi:GTP-binding protein Era|nr:GTPase Era [Spirochaetaceae bacterium]